MGSNQSASFDSIENVLEKLNNDLQSLPTMGSFSPSDFLNDLQKIKSSQESMGKPTEIVDQIYNLCIEQSQLKSYDPKQKELHDQITELLVQVPNPLVDENDDDSREFWLGVYNLLVYDIISHSKFSAMSKSGNVPTFDHRVQELPENVTLNQINLKLNYVMDRNLDQVVNFYQMYLEDKHEFCQVLMGTFYTVDHIYAGLTYNLEVINCFSKKVQNLILMHVILNNRSDFSGEFRYSKDDDHLKLPESIENSDQYLAIDSFEDVLDVVLFTVSRDYENLSFLRQPMYQDFIEEHSEYFNETFEKRHQTELEKKLKTST